MSKAPRKEFELILHGHIKSFSLTRQPCCTSTQLLLLPTPQHQHNTVGWRS